MGVEAGFINQAITFLITAAVVYFLLILPMNKLQERRKATVDRPPAPVGRTTKGLP
mgnify:CR=1 FL=1